MPSREARPPGRAAGTVKQNAHGAQGRVTQPLAVLTQGRPRGGPRASAVGAASVTRPPHIILFPLPIILFSNSQNDPLLFLYNSFLCESAHYSFFPAHVGNRGGAKAVQEG